MDKDVLRSYFEEYSPSAKAFQMQGGADEFFHEVARFLLEVGFVSPRFYCMPKKRAGFIIATYEGEIFDWGLLSANALREQLYGVQQGKPMKPIFARWLSVLFPSHISKSQPQEQRPPRPQAPRPRRQVQREEWQEEESTHVDTTQSEPEQQPASPQPQKQPATQPESGQQPDLRTTTPLHHCSHKHNKNRHLSELNNQQNGREG